MDPMSGFDIRLVFTLAPRVAETVHCSTKDVYTSEMTFLAFHPWSAQSRMVRSLGNLSAFQICKIRLMTKIFLNLKNI